MQFQQRMQMLECPYMKCIVLVRNTIHTYEPTNLTFKSQETKQKHDLTHFKQADKEAREKSTARIDRRRDTNQPHFIQSEIQTIIKLVLFLMPALINYI